MKQDARLILNKKKGKFSGQISRNKMRGKFSAQTSGNRSTGQRAASAIDARKIINSKRAGNVKKRANFAKHSSFVQRSLPVVSPKPNKNIKIANDGNIWITAKSKKSSPSNLIRTTANRDVGFSSRNKFQWTPAQMDSYDLEHARLEDVVDINALPSASTVRAPAALHSRTLAEEVMHMSNTMVADQVQTAVFEIGSQIVVSNLCSSVSKQDIVELFSDVGLMKSVAMTVPGTAVIEFYTQQDAAHACAAYHNRLLDGQPMKCYLQPDTAPQRVSISQRLGERVHEMQQPSVSRASVMTNPRLRTNPRDVHFTVKLG